MEVNEAVTSRDGQKVKRHCARCWWMYACFVTIVLVIVLPVIYVAYPTMAQDDIDHARLIVTSYAVLSPAAHSFYLKQTAMLIGNGTESATLAAWTADLCIESHCNYPFAQIGVPESRASNGTEVQIEQSVRIANMTEFIKYIQLALAAEEYHVFLHGSGALHKKGLPSVTVNYDKNITLKGLNGLAGFNVTSFDIVSPPVPNGSNVQGTVSIPNPSLSTYELGNVNMNLSVAGIPIGACSVQNVLLQPGDNTFPMVATVDQTAIATLVLGPYNSGTIPVDVVVTQVLYDGEDIPWYEEVLQGLTLRVDLNVMEALQELEAGAVSTRQ